MMYSVRPAKLCLALAISVLMADTSALAQALNPAASPADDFMRRHAEQNLQQRLDAIEEATPQAAPSVRSDQTGPEAGAASGPCFSISYVDVEGVTLLSRTALDPVLTPYRNNCIGLADINVLLKDLTNLYMDAGYITSRVYVPEQDIAGTKVLRLVSQVRLVWLHLLWRIPPVRCRRVLTVMSQAAEW